MAATYTAPCSPRTPDSPISYCRKPSPAATDRWISDPWTTAWNGPPIPRPWPACERLVGRIETTSTRSTRLHKYPIGESVEITGRKAPGSILSGDCYAVVRTGEHFDCHVAVACSAQGSRVYLYALAHRE